LAGADKSISVKSGKARGTSPALDGRIDPLAGAPPPPDPDAEPEPEPVAEEPPAAEQAGAGLPVLVDSLVARGVSLRLMDAVDGAELTLEAHTPGRPETTGRMLSVVAGGRYARGCRRPVRLVLPIFGRAAGEDGWSGSAVTSPDRRWRRSASPRTKRGLALLDAWRLGLLLQLEQARELLLPDRLAEEVAL
jgi:hypothetical protein